MLWISVNCWHSSEIDEVVSLHGSELQIYFRNIACLEVVNGKDRLFLIHLNHHFVPSVVVQILGGGGAGGEGGGGGGCCGNGKGRRRLRSGR